MIRTCSPDLPKWHESTPDFTAVYQWPVISDRDVGNTEALLHLRSLAGEWQIEVSL